MERSDFDELLEIRYPIRGLKGEGDEWEISDLSYEEIQELKTDFLFRSFSLFSDYSCFKVLPHGKGTMDERPTVIEALKILSEEENLWDAWEREKSMNKK